MYANFYLYPLLRAKNYNVRYFVSKGKVSFEKDDLEIVFQVGLPLMLIDGQTFRFSEPVWQGAKGLMLSNVDGRLFSKLLKAFEDRQSVQTERVAKMRGGTEVFLSDPNVMKKDIPQEGSFQKKSLRNEQSSMVDAGQERRLPSSSKQKNLVVKNDEEKRIGGQSELFRTYEQFRSPLHRYPEKIDLLVIDPGHGGFDPGAISYELREKKMTLLVALDVKKKLEQKIFRSPRLKGAKIIATRETDKAVSLESRARLANDALLENEAGLFVSLHFNSWVDGRARGMEVYHLSHGSQNFTMSHLHRYGAPWETGTALTKAFTFLEVVQYQNESRDLAVEIVSQIKQYFPQIPVRRGVRAEQFYVLRGVLMPAVLIEAGFISSVQDMQIFANPRQRILFAEVLANSIISYAERYAQASIALNQLR